MIIGSNTKLEVGKLDKGIVDIEYNAHKEQPFLIIREATFEEWKESVESNGEKLNPWQIEDASKPDKYFYEISID